MKRKNPYSYYERPIKKLKIEIKDKKIIVLNLYFNETKKAR